MQFCSSCGAAWSDSRAKRLNHSQIGNKLAPLYGGIKLLMLIGWSCSAGSIKRDLGRRNLHGSLIRQPAALLNKWKCSHFHSSLCLFFFLLFACLMSEDFAEFVFFMWFSSLLLLSGSPLSACLATSQLAQIACPKGSHPLSVIKKITSSGPLSWCLVWFDLTESDGEYSSSRPAFRDYF